MCEKTMALMIGIQGSGKSAFCQEHLSSLYMVIPKVMRFLFCFTKTRTLLEEKFVNTILFLQEWQVRLFLWS